MLIECQQPDHRIDEASGAVVCSDPECLVAAVHGLPVQANPMSRLPTRRPSWILKSPDRLDAREVDALAVLGDAGLVPQIVSAAGEDDPIDLWPEFIAEHRAG